jgi:Pyruvate/2-oxoacid:ferredoxin oxidoreductase delta subunit
MTKQEADKEAERYNMIYSYYVERARANARKLTPEERLSRIDKEASVTLTDEEIKKEAERCLSCGFCFDCGTCWEVCGENIMPRKGEPKENSRIVLTTCKGCGHCMDACPCGYIEMVDPQSRAYMRSNRTGQTVKEELIKELKL